MAVHNKRGTDLSVPTLFKVKGKVALVTGGGSGIGAMIAEALVQNGAKVYVASRKEMQLKKVCDRLNAIAPDSASYFVANLGSKEGCDALATEIKKHEQKLHILVNNSGVTWGAPWDKTPEKEGWDRVMAVNVKSLFYLTVALTDLLAKAATTEDPARVINISSTSSFDTDAVHTPLAADGNGVWAYNTSKAAANHLTQLMATTLSEKLITVNAILPGIFPSKMTAFGFQAAGEAINQAHPMGRAGTTQDMAGLALFLCSPASRHLTGVLIPIDGGRLIHGHGLAKL